MAACVTDGARRGIVTCLIALSASSGAAGQSLADLARQEAARRRSVAQPAPVYTSADLDRPPDVQAEPRERTRSISRIFSPLDRAQVQLVGAASAATGRLITSPAAPSLASVARVSHVAGGVAATAVPPIATIAALTTPVPPVKAVSGMRADVIRASGQGAGEQTSATAIAPSRPRPSTQVAALRLASTTLPAAPLVNRMVESDARLDASIAAANRSVTRLEETENAGTNASSSGDDADSGEPMPPPAPDRAQDLPALEGWEPFVLEKTAAEQAETDRLAGGAQKLALDRAKLVNLPPSRDTLRLSTGVAYLQGADWGSEITALGHIGGVRTDLNLFLTAGEQGLDMRSGRVAFLDPDIGWGVEAGDLFSELRGLNRGARFSWRGGETRRPAVSVYFRDEHAGNEPTAVTYRDSFQVNRNLSLGGEVASNGAVFLRSQYSLARLDLDTFYRYRPDFGRGQDKGLFASYDIWKGLTFGGGLRWSDATDDTSRWKLASIRVPIARGNVAFERTWYSSPASDSWSNAVTVQMPAGRVRLMHRVQWGDLTYLQRGLPLGFERQMMQSSAAYAPAKWLSFNYQVSTQWMQDGRARLWDELHTNVQLTRQSRLQLFTAFPDPFDSERLRGRFTQDLGPRYTLIAEYGRLSAFQMTRAFDGEQSRLLLMVQRNWNVPTPARGGDVYGRVVDQAGVQVEGAVVRLGPYRTVTDSSGEYAFSKLPSGQFDLKLDDDQLPANYANIEAPTKLKIDWRTRAAVDLHVLPLNTISGRVYWDRNRNGRFDAGEGIAKAVVWLNGMATATDATGTYAFFNQAPGSHRIRLDNERLPGPFVPVSPLELDVELPADRALGGIDFTLVPKQRPVIMQLGTNWENP